VLKFAIVVNIPFPLGAMNAADDEAPASSAPDAAAASPSSSGGEDALMAAADQAFAAESKEPDKAVYVLFAKFKGAEVELQVEEDTQIIQIKVGRPVNLVSTLQHDCSSLSH
jgi:hypothetical protein